MTTVSVLPALAALAVLTTSDTSDLTQDHLRRFRDYLDRWPDPPPGLTKDAAIGSGLASALIGYQRALGVLAVSADAGLAAIAHRCLVEVQLAWPDHVADVGPRPTYALPVRDIRLTGRDGVRLELEVLAGLRQRFRHDAGQHVKVVHSSAGVIQRRSYSLCTGPTSVSATGRLVLGVRTLPDSFVSGTLAEPPEELWVSPPDGSMAWRPEPDARLLLCGIGSGITPIVSIADEALHTPGCVVDVLVVDRGPREAMLLEDLEGLTAAHSRRLTVHTLWTRDPARRPLTAERVTECLAEIDPGQGTAAYVCGAGEPVRLVVAELAGMGVADVHHESFDTSRWARVESSRTPAAR